MDFESNLLTAPLRRLQARSAWMSSRPNTAPRCAPRTGRAERTGDEEHLEIAHIRVERCDHAALVGVAASHDQMSSVQAA